MAHSQQKCFLLGLDGLPPRVFDQFVGEGCLPRFGRLLTRAARFEAIPTLPALTSPGWAAIASGAHPMALGISNILLPVPGAAPDVIANGFDRDHLQAEPLWETMSRAGLEAVVLKYPGSWPPRPGRFLQVDGAGGYADITCRFDVVSSQAYATRGDTVDPGAAAAHFPAGYREHWRTNTGSSTGVVAVTARDPAGWRGLPTTARPAFEVALPLQERGRRQRRILHGLALVLDGREAFALSFDKDLSCAEAVLHRETPWSGWIAEGRSERRYACRLKLLHLDLARRGLWLYRTAGHRLDGFTRPLALAGELVDVLGPVCEWTGAYDLMNGLLDFETQLEVYRQHTEWLAGAIRHLGTTRAWHGFFTQWHVIEYAHHLIGASLSPDHPLHDPARRERDLDWLRRVYGLAEVLLAAVEAVIDDQTLLAVVSDHGHDLVHTVFYINHFLRRHGLLATRDEGGRQAIDWTRTRAYGLFPGLVLFNLADRWPGGIVAATDVPALTREVTEALRGLSDPRTGGRPVKVVLDRDDLAAFGQGGPRAPDLFFCMDRGYEPATRIEEGARGALELEITVPYQEVTSGHGSFFPASPSARTLALLAGGGFGPCPAGERPVLSVVDLAPTLAAHLGIAPPLSCQGRAVHPAGAGRQVEVSV